MCSISCHSFRDDDGADQDAWMLGCVCIRVNSNL